VRLGPGLTRASPPVAPPCEGLADSLALMRELGDRGAVAELLGSLGRLAYIHGDLDQAVAACEEAVTLARQVSEPSLLAEQLTDLGQVVRRRGELDRAAALGREALALLRGLGRRTPGAAATLECVAMTLTAVGQRERSARLFGAAAALRTTVGYPQKMFRRQEMEEAVAQAWAAIGEERWVAAFAAGRSLSLEEAITEALGEAEIEGQTVAADAAHDEA
jgi:tetratricopeptide (TPR) repeat protein